jgi:hypothetical protein
MSKIKVATLQGKWTGDFDSNNAWYVEQARALKGKGYDLVVFRNSSTRRTSRSRRTRTSLTSPSKKDHPTCGPNGSPSRRN